VCETVSTGQAYLLTVGILRGLGSRLLACGCLIGVYETYSGKTLSIVDARGEGCQDKTHRLNSVISDQRPGDSAIEAGDTPGCSTS
jgi:hypothetical protein